MLHDKRRDKAMKHICATLLLLCSSPFSETENAFIQEVKECALQVNADMQPYDRIPINLVIAQAIHESDWGKSRFAVEGNNLFGIKAVEGEDYILSKSNNAKVKTYLTRCESIVDFIELLSFGEPYKEFKQELVDSWVVDRVDIYYIIEFLYNYAEDRFYKQKITKILKQLERY
jgi:Bax protein